jgi:type II secretion system protein G
MLYAYWPAQQYWFDDVSVVETGKDEGAPARWAARREKAAREVSDEADQKKREAHLVIEAVRKALERYKRDTGAYPPTLDALVLDPSPAPESAWAGPYVPELATDPWGHPYRYVREGTGYTLRSFGPDGEEGGGDDVE